MATAKITKRTVDALRPGARDQFLWDTDCRGFGVKRTPAGKAVFLVQYRMHGGRAAKTTRYTIGPMGVWTPDTARDEAERLLRLVAQGTDPARERQRNRLEAAELAFNSYADRFLKIEGKRQWKGRSYGFAESIIRLHLKPAFGDTPLPQLSRNDIARMLDGLPSNSTAVRRNAFAVLRRLLRWAVGRGDIAANPLEGFEPPPPAASRDRVLEDQELIVLFEASRAVADPYGAFVRLLTITGQRRNEVAGMEWAELNRDRREWLVPAERAKNGAENLLPLSILALAELDALAGGEKWPKRGLVFASANNTPISGYSKAKRALDVKMGAILRQEDKDAVLRPWRLHDLRRTMATGMQRLRVPGDVIEACENRLAGRSKSGSARVYQRHDFSEEKREAMDKWSGFLAALLNDGVNVVPLAKAG